MKTRLAITAAILRKDFTVLWPLFLASAIAVAVAVFAPVPVLDSTAGARGALLSLLPAAAVLMVLLTAIIIVHQDPVPGVRQDWLTRPVPWQSLISAKMVLMAGACVAPVVVAMVTKGLISGQSLAESVVAVVTNWSMLLTLPVFLALIAVTSSTLQAVIVAAVMFVATVAHAIQRDYANPFATGSDQGGQWIGIEIAAWLQVVGALYILWLLYVRRRVTAARLLTAGGYVLTILVMTYIPENAALAMQDRLSPDPAAAAKLTLVSSDDCRRLNKTFLPSHTDYLKRRGLGADSPAISSALSAQGAPAGWKAEVRGVRNAAYAKPFAGKPVAANFGFGWASTDRVGQIVVLHKAAFDQDIPVRLTASLAVYKPRASITVPVDGRRRFYPGFGWCTSSRDRGTQPAIRTNCRAVGRLASTYSATAGSQTGACQQCGTEAYKPRFLRGLSSTASWRMTGPDLRQAAEVMVTPYDFQGRADHTVVLDPRGVKDAARTCKNITDLERISTPITVQM